MKQLFLISFVIFASFFAVSAQQMIDLQVNGVKIATPYSVVVQKLGKPSSKKKGGTFPCDNNGEMLTLRYQGLVIKLIEANDGTGYFVGAINITSAKWSASGINIGATVKEVRDRFGNSELTKKLGLKNLSYGMGEGFADFYFRNGKLVKINWEFNIC